MVRSDVCCFTGHRKIAAADRARLLKKLDETIARFTAEGVRVFRAGGALGFDTLAALAVLDRRDRGAPIELELFLPCRDQAARWLPRERALYEEILSRADRVFCLQEAYTDGCMLTRNRRMLEGCGRCIAYATSERGGTAYTVRYANRLGIPVLNLASCEENFL